MGEDMKKKEEAKRKDVRGKDGSARKRESKVGQGKREE